jgi:mono/diheme cytochrome c family protein
LNPKPRNFHSVDEKWTVGTSPLGVFNVLSVGIAGTSMASYASLSEDDRWALTHYIRQWVPENQLQESTEDEVVDVCRALSTPPKPPAIPLEVAINALIKDYPTSRAREFAKYGDVLLHAGADAAKGEAVYNASCASCHGAGGVGSANGPYGAFPPYLYLQVNRLVPAMAGGDTASFAQRSIGGVHATLPDMSAASHLTVEDWRNVQAYVARFEGEGTVRVNEPAPPQVDAVEEPAAQAPATESVE